jgi:ribulose 1,5-bisphosphate carboxylase large subunit-like protein
MFFADQPVTEGHLHNLVAELLGDIEAIKTRAKVRLIDESASSAICA